MSPVFSRGLAGSSRAVAATATALLLAAAASGCGATPNAGPSGAPTSSSTSSQPLGESSVVGLSGWLFYVGYDRVFRLTPDGLVLVLSDAYSASVSPDGGWIAYGDEQGHLFVADSAGGQVRALVADEVLVVTGFEPSWSPDSRRLLVGRSLGDGGVELGVVEVSSGSFTPLAHQVEAIHPLWSVDGSGLGFATGTCEVGVADADGGNAALVPVVGDVDVSVNPLGRRSCDPFSLSADGVLMAVNQRAGDEPDGDIGRDGVANAVVDTATGAQVSVPVVGQVSAVLFLADGAALVRSTDVGVTSLTLLNPDLTVANQFTEPSTVADTCAEVGCSLLTYAPA